jgi:DNA polymerase-1
MALPLLIVDVPWLLYRSFFALPSSIVGSDGDPVNALLGTVNAILSVSDPRPGSRGVRAVAACIGAEQARYRVELYPPYHAHREPMPEPLAGQWRKAPALLEALGWTVSATEELEADDLMYSFALAEQERGGRALLMTADRDLFAAVTDRVAWLELGRGGKVAQIGPQQVRERYGVGPELVPDFIALRGDPSDGLPGAPGVGAKTAAELLRAHGSLERALAAAGADEQGSAAAAVRASTVMRPRLAAALRENAEQLLRFKQVATLQRVEVEPPPDRASDLASGADAAQRLGMRRLAERLRGLAGASR